MPTTQKEPTAIIVRPQELKPEMASSAHVKLIKGGSKGWNLWRAENPKIRPDLTFVNLREADLSEADLSGADLSRADLSGTDLSGADLRAAALRGADLSRAGLGYTTFDDNDLSTTKGLETVIHSAPSTIGIDTLFRSDGKIPEAFLRGAGVPEDFITFIPSLVGRAIEFYSCFISHSNKDKEFSQRLHSRMRAKIFVFGMHLKT